MDNAKTHTSKKVLEFLESQEFEVLYAVPYMPELNAIEFFLTISSMHITRESTSPGKNIRNKNKI